MVTEELISYIKSQLDSGLERNDIVKILKSQGGWQETDIADAFAQIGKDKLPNNNHQKVGGEMSKPIITDQQTSQENDSTDKDMLKVQEERDKTQTSQQSSQGGHHPDSILGQASKKEKGGGSKKKIILVVVVIVLLGVFAGAAYGYFTYFKNPKPITLLMQTAAKGMEVTVAKETGNLKFGLDIVVDSDSDSAIEDLFTNDKTSFEYLVSYDMEYDISDVANQKVDGFLTFGLDGDMGLETVNFDGTVDVKMVDNIVYLQLRDTTPFMELDLREYEDRWIEIDLENIMPGIGIDMTELMATQGEQQEKIKEAMKELLGNKEIVEIINRSGQIKDTKDANGNNEYHLTFQINKEDWKELIKQFMITYKDLAIEMVEEEMQSKGYSGYEEPTMEEIFAELETNLESEEAGMVFEVLEKIIVELWITKDTMLTRKSSMLLDAPGIKIEDEYSGEITVDINFSGESETDYDVTVEVIPPEETTPVQEFIEEVSGMLMGGAQQKAEYASVKANFKTISVMSELYYDDNEFAYGSPVEASEEACMTENTMFEDKMIKSSFENVKNVISTGVVECAIGKGGQSWVISSDGPNLWCADSTGFAGKSGILETGGENSEARCGEEADNN